MRRAPAGCVSHRENPATARRGLGATLGSRAVEAPLRACAPGQRGEARQQREGWPTLADWPWQIGKPWDRLGRGKRGAGPQSQAEAAVLDATVWAIFNRTVLERSVLDTAVWRRWWSRGESNP